MVGRSTFPVLVKSTRPDLGDSLLGSVDGKREPKRENAVLLSASSPIVSTLSSVSPATNSSVLATAPLDVLGVAVKRSEDKETEGWPPKPS